MTSEPPEFPLASPSTALITGASGFIGRALRSRLRSMKLQLRTIDTHPELPGASTGSVLDPDALVAATAGVGVVFHLAGLIGTTELLSRNAEAIAVNITGTVNVLEACRASSVSTVFIPTKPNDWLNTYSITKKAAEDFAIMFAQLHGMDIRLLRWLNIYGPGQKTHPVRKAVPTMILQALEGIDIEVFGSGEQPVDLTYVEDIAHTTALYTLTGPRSCAVLDSGNSIRMSVNELALLIRRLAQSRSRITHLPMRPGEDPERNVELSELPNAAEIVGTAEATTPLDEGMSRTIAHYAKLPQQTKREALAFFERDRSR